VKRRLSTAFHPQTDGQTERQNQTLEHYLRCYCCEQQDDWASLLPMAEFASNNSKSATLGISPYYALMGYNPSLTVELPRGEPTGEGVPAAEERAKRLRTEREALEERWRRAQESQARSYNKNHTPKTYKVGDLVLLSLKNLKIRAPSRKLAPRRQGPYRIVDLVGNQAYRLALPNEMSRIHNVFHVSLLEPWRSRDGSEELPMLVDLEDGNAEEYEVESILDKRIVKGQTKYLIRWKGWPEDYNKWEPEEHLEGAPDLLREFNASVARTQQKRRKGSDKR